MNDMEFSCYVCRKRGGNSVKAMKKITKGGRATYVREEKVNVKKREDKKMEVIEAVNKMFEVFYKSPHGYGQEEFEEYVAEKEKIHRLMEEM